MEKDSSDRETFGISPLKTHLLTSKEDDGDFVEEIMPVGGLKRQEKGNVF
jgi:hypothetical protein